MAEPTREELRVDARLTTFDPYWRRVLDQLQELGSDKSILLKYSEDSEAQRDILQVALRHVTGVNFPYTENGVAVRAEIQKALYAMLWCCCSENHDLVIAAVDWLEKSHF